MLIRLFGVRGHLALTLVGALILTGAMRGAAQLSASIHNEQLTVSVQTHDGSYSIRAKGLEQPVLVAHVGAEIDRQWVRSSEYPKQLAEESTFQDDLGSGHALRITYSGLAGKPDLVTVLRLYDQHAYGDVEVTVRNTTGKALSVQAIRSMEAAGKDLVNLGGREGADRVLSDSFSEDRPDMRILDLAQAPEGVHRGVGSQLIYNRESKQSLLLATLTSRRLLNILHLHVENVAGGEPKITSYTVDSTGTTEIEVGESLKTAPPEDRIELSSARGGREGTGFRADDVCRGERLSRATGSLRRCDQDSASGASGSPKPHRLVELDGLLRGDHGGAHPDQSALASPELEGLWVTSSSSLMRDTSTRAVNIPPPTPRNSPTACATWDTRFASKG